MEIVKQADLDVKILAVKELAEHCKGFVVERPQDFLYHPGQYMLIEIAEDYGTPFSLASSPTEEVLKFATVIRDGSPLKEEMDAKEPGNNFIVSGPYGELIYEKKEKKIGLIAGGIGVPRLSAFCSTSPTKAWIPRPPCCIPAKRSGALRSRKSWPRSAPEIRISK